MRRSEWQNAGLKRHEPAFKISNDPQFEEKVVDVVTPELPGHRLTGIEREVSNALAH